MLIIDSDSRSGTKIYILGKLLFVIDEKTIIISERSRLTSN
jgi:hypothetical protein